MKKEDCYHVGKVTQPHGVKGEVKIWLDVDMPEEYDDMDSVLLEIKGQLVPYFIEQLQIKGRKSIALFEGMKSWEDTQKIVGADMYLPLDVLPDLNDDQFYYHEIAGYQVIDKNTNAIIGEVAAVYESTGQDLLAVNVEDKEVLIPISDSIVVGINKPEKQLFVNLPDGLLDVYLG